MILGSAPIEGRFSGVVDIPNSCATVYIPRRIFDFDVAPVEREAASGDAGRASAEVGELSRSGEGPSDGDLRVPVRPTTAPFEVSAPDRHGAGVDRVPGVQAARRGGSSPSRCSSSTPPGAGGGARPRGEDPRRARRGHVAAARRRAQANARAAADAHAPAPPEAVTRGPPRWRAPFHVSPSGMSRPGAGPCRRACARGPRGGRAAPPPRGSGRTGSRSGP